MGINQEDFEKLNMRGIIISSIMTAFGLVVALAWKDTINATVAHLMPDNDDGTLKGMYITAVAVTALVMGLAMAVLKINVRVEKEIERVQSYFNDDDDEEENKEPTFERLKVIKDLLDSGTIDKDDYEKMKQEINGNSKES